MRAASISTTGAIESLREGKLFMSNVVDMLTCYYELMYLFVGRKINKYPSVILCAVN